uniref:Uncharacterized protein n=1 Tax=Fagus sylvatica TaxID=28930 RepID=A0A2N9E400_FAGSY
MTIEASRSDSQEAYRIMLGEKLNELLNLVHLMLKYGAENEVQTADTGVPRGEPEGQPLTNTDLPPKPPPKFEDNEDQFAKKVSKVDSKSEDLKQKDKLTLGLNSFSRTNFSNMSWFPNLIVTHEFNIPKFEKFNGNEDPTLHLQMYCGTMAPYAGNERLLIMTFQESLSSHAASCTDCLDLQRMERISEEALVPRDQGDTIDFHSDADKHSLKKNEESKKRFRSLINRVVIQKEKPKEADFRMTPHKRHASKDMAERVEYLEKQLNEMVQSMHQLITLTGTLLKDDRRAIRRLAFHSPIGQTSKEAYSAQVRPKLTSKFCNPDDPCSFDREKSDHPTNRYMTLKRKIQELGHLEPEVSVVVQLGKPNMHTIHTKRIKSTADSHSCEPSKDQTD